MRYRLRIAMVLACLLVVPVAAFAQGTISGVVKDASGAILPGVTVEASSPTLIEKTRTVVTDGSGQYQIVNLRPGTYSVTFTLAGFETSKRDGLQVSGSLVASLNAEMRIGSVAETLTVTGESPIVDVQSVTKERVMTATVMEALPSGRFLYNFGALVPGVQQNASTGNRQDVGGILGDLQSSLVAHGSRNVDQRTTMNGLTLSTLAGGGQLAGSTPQMAAAQEVAIDTSAVSAELPTGGPRVNLIPREGGNTYSGSVFANFSSAGLQADNFDQRLRDLGLTARDSLNKNIDFNPAGGGPIIKDHLWLFATGRYNYASNYVAGMFYNLNALVGPADPRAWIYAPDKNHQASQDVTWRDAQGRVTWQANAKNKFAVWWDQQTKCGCPYGIDSFTSPESGSSTRYNPQRFLSGEWSSPLTSRLLFEFGGLAHTERTNRDKTLEPELLALLPVIIPVTDQGLSNLTYRGTSSSYNTGFSATYNIRGAVSYVTGSHAFKVGFGDVYGNLNAYTYDFQPLRYRFNNGVPNQVTEMALPTFAQNDQHHDLGVYAQDKWTDHRLTLTLGIRFDSYSNGWPEQHIGPSAIFPNRNITFPAADGVAFKDITPRMGAVYDVFGNGRTAFRVSLNKYLTSLGLGNLATASNPVNTLVTSTTRAWSDTNKNFVVDCNLANPAAQTVPGGDTCGAMANSSLGTSVPGATYDPDLITGWGHRNSNWEFSAGVQHQLLSWASVDAGYFRRWYGNFQVTDNLLVAATDYTPFSITAPVDTRLPGGGGYTIGGLYDLNPNKVGQVQNYNTLSDKYGKEFEHWNGMDVSLNVRPQGGVLIQGGFSTGRTVTDDCAIIAQLPEMLTQQATSLIVTSAGVQTPATACHLQTPFLTQVKVLTVYTIPKVAIQISGTLQSFPGPVLAATYNAPNALVAPSLGRSLSGGAANASVNLLQPGTMFGERIEQLDLRFGKILKFGRTRTSLSLDIYNVLNTDTVLQENSAYTAWRLPTNIMPARLAKVAAQFNF